MTSAYPDYEGQVYTTSAPDGTYTEAEARQRAASHREMTATANAAGAAALASAKTYTDAAIAAAKIDGGGVTVGTIQAMIRDELDAGNYAGPAGRSITSFGSQDPVTGVVPVHFSDGSTVQLTLPVGGGAVDEATLTQAIEDVLAGGDYAGPPGRGVLSFSSPDEAGVVIVNYDDGSSGELQLPAGGGSAGEAALLAAYETAMG